jgi:hypothetical protein
MALVAPVTTLVARHHSWSLLSYQMLDILLMPKCGILNSHVVAITFYYPYVPEGTHYHLGYVRTKLTIDMRLAIHFPHKFHTSNRHQSIRLSLFSVPTRQ